MIIGHRRRNQRIDATQVALNTALNQDAYTENEHLPANSTSYQGCKVKVTANKHEMITAKRKERRSGGNVKHVPVNSSTMPFNK